ncbi:MAG TPA: single-stranded DNA-binding protein [Chloroflexota bacterium]|nr:single-stranded DNA-binding protein [Chloroflexota bacterium]
MLKALIIGNLGGDPDEPRYTAEGRPFVSFNVASNYRARGPDGEPQDKTEWLRVTVFGRQAEVVTQYLRKGSRVYVEGRLEARPWIDNQQQPRAGLQMIANDIQFMSSRMDDEAAGIPRAGGAGLPGSPDQPARPAGPRPVPGPAEEAEVEDLPF